MGTLVVAAGKTTEAGDRVHLKTSPGAPVDELNCSDMGALQEARTGSYGAGM